MTATRVFLWMGIGLALGTVIFAIGSALIAWQRHVSRRP